MRKIASIKNDLSLELMEGELIESDGTNGVSSNGDLTVSEIIESDGEVNKYLSFDGVDDTIDNVGVNNFDWNEGTWEFWIRTRTDFANLPSSYYESLFGAEQYSPSFRLRVYARGSASFYFTFVSRGGNVRFPSSRLMQNEWTHIAITYSAINGQMESYIDGVRASTSSFAYSDVALNSSFSIGKTMNHNNFNGDMKEFRVWNKALTQTEIQENMNKSLMGSEEDLVLYLPMDEGKGAFVGDKTDNGNDGMINGTEWVEEVSEGDSQLSIDSNGVLTLSELREGI